jgi:hypothetical protein
MAAWTASATGSVSAGRHANRDPAARPERLDAAYQDTAANLPKNAAVQVDGGELVLSVLDKLEEPPSFLVALKAAVATRMALLVLVDLPELLLEMHTRTDFADGFTHASEGGARAGGVTTSLCAVLLAEACNTGFEPPIRRDNPAVRRLTAPPRPLLACRTVWPCMGSCLPPSRGQHPALACRFATRTPSTGCSNSPSRRIGAGEGGRSSGLRHPCSGTRLAYRTRASKRSIAS